MRLSTMSLWSLNTGMQRHVTGPSDTGSRGSHMTKSHVRRDQEVYFLLRTGNKSHLRVLGSSWSFELYDSSSKFSDLYENLDTGAPPRLTSLPHPQPKVLRAAASAVSNGNAVDYGVPVSDVC